MNENLDLTKVLAGCPAGTKFYSSVYGEVIFERIEKHVPYPIILSYNDRCNRINVTQKGLHYKGFNGECVLFPSKDQRDWSKFERFWDKPKVEKFDPKTFLPFDKILARDCTDERWSIEIFSHKTGNVVRGLYSNWMYAIPFNEETKHLLGTTDDCPEFYKWWEE